MVMEVETAKIKEELTDMFSFIHCDEPEDNFQEVINRISEKKHTKEDKFDKEKFNETISLNFNQTIEAK